MKKIIQFSFLVLLIGTSYAQIDIVDKSKEPDIKAIPYDGSFSDFKDIMLTEEQKAGVVGEKITLFKAWTIKNLDGTTINYSDSEKFENKTFEVVEYTYKYKDILKIKNEDGIYLFEPGITDEYVFNSFIDITKKKLLNKTLIPLKLKGEIETLSGEKIEIDGLKEYIVEEVNFAKLSSGFGIVVKLNGEIELLYPTGKLYQREEKGWLNLESADIFKTKAVFLEKEVFEEYAKDNKLYLDNIRSGIVKVGMTEKQCRDSWGMPTSAMSNIAGYETVLIYGKVGSSKNLYFNKGILKLIR